MEGLTRLWSHGDAVTVGVAALLALMSVSAWSVILWKAWLLGRVRRDIERALAAFWAAPTEDEGHGRLLSVDRDRTLVPLLAAAMAQMQGATLAARGHVDSQLTRRLRGALQQVLAQLQFGQVLLASIGSTAPFIGLFGTVWGIYHALLGIALSGSMSIERIAGPVGEALVMTAAGLAVAIPAVLAYNVFGKMISAREAELEGFAHDLREMILDTPDRR